MPRGHVDTVGGHIANIPLDLLAGNINIARQRADTISKTLKKQGIAQTPQIRNARKRVWRTWRRYGEEW